MKRMGDILKYIDVILRATDNRKPIPVSSIKYKEGEGESFKQALQDLHISGMIVYTQLNPVIMIKRIA